MTFPLIGITSRAEQGACPSNPFLYAVAQSYVRAVELCQGAPLIIPPHLEQDHLRAIFERLDGLLLSGGGDIEPTLFGEQTSGLLWQVDGQRDRTELALARWALTEKLPLLAICRGIQVLNVAAGGTLIQDIPTQVPGALAHNAALRPLEQIAHTVEIATGSRLAGLVESDEMAVNSAHHQAVKTIGAGLVVVARAPDGIIEGLEASNHPFCVGVQWHPEVLVEDRPEMRRLFEGLIESARNC